jgi:hypothetical protein
MRTQDAFYYTQIEMPAKGCVSGRLKEWPVLQAALKDCRFDLPPDTLAYEIQQVCQALINRTREIK